MGSVWDVNDLTRGTESFNFHVTRRAIKLALVLQQVLMLSFTVRLFLPFPLTGDRFSVSPVPLA
jgi:hypothetical protein